MPIAGQATWRHSLRLLLLGLEGERWSPRDLLSRPLRAGLSLPLRSLSRLFSDLSERVDRDEAEDPEAEEREVDEPDLELLLVLLDPDGERVLCVLDELLAVLFSLAGAATNLGGFVSCSCVSGGFSSHLLRRS